MKLLWLFCVCGVAFLSGLTGCNPSSHFQETEDGTVTYYDQFFPVAFEKSFNTCSSSNNPVRLTPGANEVDVIPECRLADGDPDRLEIRTRLGDCRDDGCSFRQYFIETIVPHAVMTTPQDCPSTDSDTLGLGCPMPLEEPIEETIAQGTESIYLEDHLVPSWCPGWICNPGSCRIDVDYTVEMEDLGLHTLSARWEYLHKFGISLAQLAIELTADGVPHHATLNLAARKGKCSYMWGRTGNAVVATINALGDIAVELENLEVNSAFRLRETNHQLETWNYTSASFDRVNVGASAGSGTIYSDLISAIATDEAGPQIRQQVRENIGGMLDERVMPEFEAAIIGALPEGEEVCDVQLQGWSPRSLAITTSEECP